jgi:branched-chain amino acid transport system ATP-binding protein
VLTVDDLHVAYGNVRAVRGIRLQARAGQITLVLGPNGAGKTTTLRSVAGLHPPSGGRVLLDGVDVTGLPAHALVRRGLALVPEGRRIFGPLTVEENLRLGAYLADRAVYLERISTIYDLFPVLAERRHGPGGLLSGGEQQMLAFGRALMSGPSVILMDEPSMGLAPTMVDTVFEQVRAISDVGVAVVAVEQNADAALDIADEVVVLDRGEVVFRGSVADARSQGSVVRAFLGEGALVESGELDGCVGRLTGEQQP